MRCSFTPTYRFHFVKALYHKLKNVQAAHGKPFSGTFLVPENENVKLRSYLTILKKYFSGTKVQFAASFLDHRDDAANSINLLHAFFNG